MPRPIDPTLFDDSGPDVRSFSVEAAIDASPADVYRAWTDATGFLAAYENREGMTADIELAIGGSYEWLFDGSVGSNGCQVLSYVPGRMVSFTWNAPPTQPESRARRTWVVVDVEPAAGGGTRVRLTHLGFGEAAHWDETMAYFQAAWPSVLEQFASVLGRR